MNKVNCFFESFSLRSFGNSVMKNVGFHSTEHYLDDVITDHFGIFIGKARYASRKDLKVITKSFLVC